MNYDVVPVDRATVQDHQQVADLYFNAGVIRQRVDVSAAFDLTVYK
jgi:hypothetical protein